MTTQHNTHKASNHLVNRSSYIHQGTYQLGFSGSRQPEETDGSRLHAGGEGSRSGGRFSARRRDPAGGVSLLRQASQAVNRREDGR
jgi:hypothetical protein